jgi:hypothetical protein
MSEALQGMWDNIMIDSEQRLSTDSFDEYVLLAGKKTQTSHCRDSKLGQVFIQTEKTASDQELTTTLSVTTTNKNKGKE